MKKRNVLLLALVIVLAVGNMAFAAPLNGTNPNDVARLTGEINVTGTVGPYAAIFVTDGEVDLDWTGRELEASYGAAAFEIKSNTPIELSATFGPLSTVFEGTRYGITTTVDIERYDGRFLGFPVYWPILGGVVGPNGAEQTFQSSPLLGLPIQKVEHKQYRIGIGGILRDIHDQAAGDYETTVTITLASAN